jgi:cupin-like protein
VTSVVPGIAESYTVDPKPVARVHRPERQDFYRRFVRTRTPAIITGLMDEWPAMRNWTPSYLFKHLGDVDLPINQQDPKANLILGKIGNFIRMPAADAVRSIEEPDDDKIYYLRAFPFYQSPGLWDDVRVPDICPNWIDLRNAPFTATRKQISRVLEETLFIGGAGVTTPYHSDGMSTGAILAQVAGRKHCVLISDDQTAGMYPRPFRRNFGMSRVDFRKPDAEKFPRYRNVKAQECVLEPGEILYIPHTCWHGIISKEVTISYSMQIINRANLRYFLTALALRPIAGAYYRAQGGFKRVIGAVTWE